MEGPSLFRFFIASLTVLALMGLLAFALKYVAARGWTISPQSKNRRLKIIETLSLDARRRIVIIKCDDTEHLLLLAPQNDRVISSNLQKANQPLQEGTISDL